MRGQARTARTAGTGDLGGGRERDRLPSRRTQEGDACRAQQAEHRHHPDRRAPVGELGDETGTDTREQAADGVAREVDAGGRGDGGALDPGADERQRARQDEGDQHALEHARRHQVADRGHGGDHEAGQRGEHEEGEHAGEEPAGQGRGRQGDHADGHPQRRAGHGPAREGLARPQVRADLRQQPLGVVHDEEDGEPGEEHRSEQPPIGGGAGDMGAGSAGLMRRGPRSRAGAPGRSDRCA